MLTRLNVALTGAAVLVSACSAYANPAGAQSASAESGNPINDQGGSYHYRSYITAITPNVPGLGVEVLEFADRLVLHNHTGKTVTVFGYSNEPYARVQP
ncbi:MAG TPA: hypothetical protein VHS55_01335, partial [Solirubrobacteraceae bacterium]|nr:hypothetical protein [Solirubrobacteraceae bacterium]